MIKRIVFGEFTMIAVLCLNTTSVSASSKTQIGEFSVAAGTVAIVPSVNSTTGELSWTRQIVSDPTNVALPANVNIKGPQGATGPQGPQGPAGTVDQQALASAVTSEINTRNLASQAYVLEQAEELEDIISTKAAASDLNSLANTVNDATTGLAATKAIADQAATNASSATATANAVKGAFDTNSSTGAITTLKTDAVPSLAISKITDLQSTLNAKAAASDLTTLSSTVNNSTTGLAATRTLATNANNTAADAVAAAQSAKLGAQSAQSAADALTAKFNVTNGTIGTIKDSAVPSLAISKITNLQTTLDNKAAASDLTTLANTVNGETVCRGSSCTITDGLNSQVSKLLTALQNAGVITYANNNGVMSITGIQQNCSCSGSGSQSGSDKGNASN